ncbi:CHAT domain-containing protein [Nostoc sp. UIC 10630]|uniref:nSTAND1 domain-containing NTPase n=1 Tax=Nostoc sp. UIC 10630 TaxID=2100146 RepID=UPI0013D20EFA|nr:CHAT domain-containing protein [Nostoc sp. UIC 10630]NEU83746.1 CHAT domain-containing protein [Nostoc sp. UIC 10630]
MEIWVNLKFGDGDFEQGFSKIQLQIDAFSTQSHPTQLETQLPPAQEIPKSYENWKKIYDLLAQPNSRGFKKNQVTNVSADICFEYSKSLRQNLNQWLLPIKSQLEAVINLNNYLEIHLIVNTHRVTSESTKNILHRIPWQECNLFREDSSSEVALSFKDLLQKASVSATKPNAETFRRIKIISIFGDSNNIDTNTDKELILKLEKQGAEILVLKEPKRETLHKLWDEPCDILFFAGHSESQENGKKGIIAINPNDNLDLEEIPQTLKSAISKGLKLAIFNSCDGLGLAQRLADLNLPYVIVWREPVPDKIAHKFLNFFLSSYVGGDSLFTAVSKARGKLQELTGKSESEKPLPGVSWLPIICKNTLELPPSWEDLGGLSGKLPDCPYQGLSAFGEEEANFFFGREKTVDELVVAVESKSLVTVVGASGSGKSSVVFAGLVPRLRKAGNMQIISLRPGNNPFGNLAIALHNHCHSPLQLQPENITDIQRRLDQIGLEVDLRHDEKKLCDAIESIFQNLTPLPPFPTREGGSKSSPQPEEGGMSHLVLIADQFEELYTLTPPEERQPFLDALIYAINHAPRFTLVLTLRADFYGYALSYRPFSDALQQGIYNLGPMNREELRFAVEKPAQKMKVVLEEGLTDTLIRDLGNESGRLPLLEFTLTQLWQKPRKWFLTHEAYQQIGGLEKALANYADTVLDKLSEADRKRAEKIFIQLVRPGEGTEDTRRVATRKEVGDANWDLVQQLADARLLVTGCDETSENQEETVEIIHEALIREWKTFRQWIQDNREFRTWQERLRGAMQQWEISNDEGALLRGAPLAEAEGWLQLRWLDVSPDELVFIQLSLELRDKTQREEKERTQRELEQAIEAQKAAQVRNRVALISSIVLSGFAMFAFLQWSNAQQQSIVALNQASESSLLSNKQLEALVAGVQAGKQLKNAIVQPDAALKQTVTVTLQQAVYGVQERNRLIGHQSYINVATFSPDGEIIASGSSDDTIKLWSREGKLLKTVNTDLSGIISISFSPDSKLFVSGSFNSVIRLWSRDGQLLKNFPQKHAYRVSAISFSPDGQMIASGSRDKTVKLWSRDGQLIKTLSGHNKSVMGVSFSPNGQMIASIGSDETIKLWSRDGQLLHTLSGCKRQDKCENEDLDDDVGSVSFSPDNQMIVSGGYKGLIKLWTKEGQLIKTFPGCSNNGHCDRVSRVSFSPDGKTIVSASYDQTIKVWNKKGRLSKTLKGHQSVISSVSFSPDSKTIASASWDTSIRLWNVDGQRLKILSEHKKDDVNSVSFSPDGKMLASGSNDKTIKLWNRDGRLLETLSEHKAEVNSVSFSPDGKMLASGSNDKTIKLWNREGKLFKLFKTLYGHSDSVRSVSFSPNGKMLASGSSDKTIKLWNQEGQLLKTLQGHKNDIRSISFSPDGKILASASGDRTIKFWNQEGQPFKTLQGHKSYLRSVSFNPDGKTLASSSEDTTVKLWREGQEPKTLTGNGMFVNTVSFSPDGKILASGSDSNTITLWSREGKELKTLSGHRHDVQSLSFSPDGKMIASASEDNTIILWNLDLDDLLVQGCDWLRDYLKNNPNVNESDRTLCNGIGTQ